MRDLTLIMLFFLCTCCVNNQAKTNHDNAVIDDVEKTQDNPLLDKLQDASQKKEVVIEQPGKCDMQSVIDLNNTIKEPDSALVLRFLVALKKECSKNVEFSEFSNEVLFRLIEYNPQLTLTLLEKNTEQLDLVVILSEIGQPVSDTFNLEEIINNVSECDDSEMKVKILGKLEEARQRY